MMPKNTIFTGSSWYELFSRGARDWLRHNEKIREIIKNKIPDLISDSDLNTDTNGRSINIPLKKLYHARFELNTNSHHDNYCAGQGICQQGDLLIPKKKNSDSNEIEASNTEGEIQFSIEFNVSDFIDWIWEELKLPDLQIKNKLNINERYLVREGCDKKGTPSRLDRRRTIKEFIKRRVIQNKKTSLSNNDLRFTQNKDRKNPITCAVIFFVLDVSASMSTEERKLAKIFFFFILHGIRRKYLTVEIRFIAHTTQAWEFTEKEFFQVTGAGGTGASSAFNLVLDIIKNEYDSTQYNGYLFYASDGENFTEDRAAATASIKELTALLNYLGYIETVPGIPRNTQTEMSSICMQVSKEECSIGNFVLNKQEDIWKGIKHFFSHTSTRDEVF